MALTPTAKLFLSWLVPLFLFLPITVPIFFMFGILGKIVAIFALFFVLWQLAGIFKDILLKALPDEFSYEVVNLSEQAHLDQQWFATQTKDLESIGFVQLMDYLILIAQTNTFGRLFSHSDALCYTYIGQAFTKNNPPAPKEALIFTVFDQDWSLSSMNRNVDLKEGIFYGLSHWEKDVRVYSPGQAWSDLLHQHLSLRQEMICDLSISVCDRPSWENYVQREQDNAVRIKRLLKRKFTLWAMCKALQFELSPKSEWWGAYQRK